MNEAKSLMRDYVDYRLEQWADWYLRGNFYGLGYPRKTIAARFIEEGGVLINSTAHCSLPSNRLAEEIESIVAALAEQNDKLAKALRMQYFHSGTTKSRAQRAGVSYSQFRTHVDMAKQWVAGRLSVQKSKFALRGKTESIKNTFNSTD